MRHFNHVANRAACAGIKATYSLRERRQTKLTIIRCSLGLAKWSFLYWFALFVLIRNQISRRFSWWAVTTLSISLNLITSRKIRIITHRVFGSACSNSRGRFFLFLFVRGRYDQNVVIFFSAVLSRDVVGWLIINAAVTPSRKTFL